MLNIGTKFVYLLMANMAFASFDQTLVKMSNQFVKTYYRIDLSSTLNWLSTAIEPPLFE